MNAPKSKAGQVVRSLASFFFLFHVVAITCQAYPDSAYLGGALRRPFAAYIQYTRQFQLWNMFDTWDRLRSLSPMIVATDRQGRSSEFGPVLPGFRPASGDLRMHVFFQRAVLPQQTSMLEPYLRRVCERLRVERGFDAESVAIDVRFEWIRPVEKILADGIVTNAKSQIRGPYACP